jgi:hypothetical protein
LYQIDLENLCNLPYTIKGNNSSLDIDLVVSLCQRHFRFATKAQHRFTLDSQEVSQYTRNLGTLQRCATKRLSSMIHHLLVRNAAVKTGMRHWPLLTIILDRTDRFFLSHPVISPNSRKKCKTQTSLQFSCELLYTPIPPLLGWIQKPSFDEGSRVSSQSPLITIQSQPTNAYVQKPKHSHPAPVHSVSP